MIEDPDLQTLALFDDLPVPQDAMVANAVEQLAASEIEDGHGAVYTRPEVVEFILDLVGYRPDKPLHHARLLEPSFGAGDFLRPIIRRLLQAWRHCGGDVPELRQSLVAFELHRDTFGAMRTAITADLIDGGFSPADAESLTAAWLRQGDFLLADSGDRFDDVIRRLEAELPTLEEAGCKVGIGVATGADKAFIGEFSVLDVEPDRKLPLVTTKDIESGEGRWKGNGVINPFEDGGGLVDLAQYPRLATHLERNRALIHFTAVRR